MSDPTSALHAVRDAVRGAATLPGPAAVRARAERAVRVRRLTLAVAAVVAVIVLGTAGVAGIRLANGPDHPPADPPSPSVTVDESPAPSVPSSPEPSASTGLGIDARSIDLANATITMPAWPGGMGSNCQPGMRRFRGGTVASGGGSDNGFEWKYYLTAVRNTVLYGDLDGQPGEEIVVPVRCMALEGRAALLAARVRPDRTLQGLAYVTGLPFDLYRTRDGEVLVEVADNEIDPVTEQIRGYRWRGDRFVQSSGPTRFPTAAEVATEDVRKINFRNTWLTFQGGTGPDGVCLFGTVTFVDGRGRRSELERSPAATFEVGQVSTGFLAGRPRPERAQALITLRCTSDDDKRADAVYALLGDNHAVYRVVNTEEPGVAGIVRHEITPDGLARITVRLKAGGEEVRTYKRAASGLALERV